MVMGVDHRSSKSSTNPLPANNFYFPHTFSAKSDLPAPQPGAFIMVVILVFWKNLLKRDLLTTLALLPYAPQDYSSRTMARRTLTFVYSRIKGYFKSTESFRLKPPLLRMCNIMIKLLILLDLLTLSSTFILLSESHSKTSQRNSRGR